MGLTVNYVIRLAACERAKAVQFVRKLNARAAWRRPGQAPIKVFPATTDRVELERFATAWLMVPSPTMPDTTEGIAVPPLDGCIFPVSIGEDCEPLWLGLCRYPATVRHGGRDMPTKLGSGWRLSGACKTQYASLHGWDHFRQCHTTVIALLRAASELGARVRIIDEGGWWPHRSDSALRQALERLNQIVAAMAGALKDASDDEKPGAVVSPIFTHPHFERLEADGLARNKAAIADAAQLVSELRPPDADP